MQQNRVRVLVQGPYQPERTTAITIQTVWASRGGKKAAYTRLLIGSGSVAGFDRVNSALIGLRK